MDSKLNQVLLVAVVVFLAKIAIADPMRETKQQRGVRLSRAH